MSKVIGIYIRFGDWLTKCFIHTGLNNNDRKPNPILRLAHLNFLLVDAATNSDWFTLVFMCFMAGPTYFTTAPKGTYSDNAYRSEVQGSFIPE